MTRNSKIDFYRNKKIFPSQIIEEKHDILVKIYNEISLKTQSNRPKCFTGYSDDFLNELLISI